MTYRTHDNQRGVYPVKNKELLKGLRRGDRIEIALTQARAVSIDASAEPRQTGLTLSGRAAMVDQDGAGILTGKASSTSSASEPGDTASGQSCPDNGDRILIWGIAHSRDPGFRTTPGVTLQRTSLPRSQFRGF